MRFRLLFTAALLLAVASTGVANDNGEVAEISQSDYASMVSDYTSSNWNFKGVRPAIIDFNATWCGPCKRLAPILKELAKEYKGKVDFYSVDVDKNKDLARAYGIRSVPMLLFVPQQGQPQASLGLMPKGEIKKAIKLVLQVDSIK